MRSTAGFLEAGRQLDQWSRIPSMGVFLHLVVVLVVLVVFGCIWLVLVAQNGNLLDCVGFV